jgi:hypothetical protein
MKYIIWHSQLCKLLRFQHKLHLFLILYSLTIIFFFQFYHLNEMKWNVFVSLGQGVYIGAHANGGRGSGGLRCLASPLTVVPRFRLSSPVAYVSWVCFYPAFVLQLGFLLVLWSVPLSLKKITLNSISGPQVYQLWNCRYPPKNNVDLIRVWLRQCRSQTFPKIITRLLQNGDFE